MSFVVHRKTGPHTHTSAHISEHTTTKVDAHSNSFTLVELEHAFSSSIALTVDNRSVLLLDNVVLF